MHINPNVFPCFNIFIVVINRSSLEGFKACFNTLVNGSLRCWVVDISTLNCSPIWKHTMICQKPRQGWPFFNWKVEVLNKLLLKNNFMETVMVQWSININNTKKRPIPGWIRMNPTLDAIQLPVDFSAATGRLGSTITIRNCLSIYGLYSKRPLVCSPLTAKHERTCRIWTKWAY